MYEREGGVFPAIFCRNYFLLWIQLPEIIVILFVCGALLARLERNSLKKIEMWNTERKHNPKMIIVVILFIKQSDSLFIYAA